MSSKTHRGKKAGNMLIPIILGAAFVIFIIVFAFQTWFLVDWLFPSTNLFMKIGTVGSFDVMSIVWAATDTFYGFYRWRSKHIVQAMWGITFTLATICSVIQLYLASSTRLDFTLDPNIIRLAYGLVIGSLVLNLLALTFTFKLEWAASHPSHVEEDLEDDGDTVDVIEEETEPLRLPAPRAKQAKHAGRVASAWNALRGEPAQVEAPAPAMDESRILELVRRAVNEGQNGTTAPLAPAPGEDQATR